MHSPPGFLALRLDPVRNSFRLLAFCSLGGFTWLLGVVT